MSDQFDSPAPITAGSDTVGCLTDDGDKDLFVLTAPEAPAGAIIEYSLQSAGDMAPVVEVFDANRKRLDHASGGKNERVQGWVVAAGGSLVFFNVHQVHRSEQVYTLAVTATPVSEAGEPNGDFEAASTIPESGTVQGFLAPVANDAGAAEDWFRVDVSSRGVLRIDVDMSQDVAPVLEVYDGKRKRIGHVSGGKGERIQFEAKVAPGPYFLKLRSMHGLPVAASGELPTWLTRPYTITTAR